MSEQAGRLRIVSTGPFPVDTQIYLDDVDISHLTQAIEFTSDVRGRPMSANRVVLTLIPKEFVLEIEGEVAIALERYMEAAKEASFAS